MCIHVKFMSTQNVTVSVHYLPLFSASIGLSLGLSVEDFFTLTFHVVVLALQLDWLVSLNG